MSKKHSHRPSKLDVATSKAVTLLISEEMANSASANTILISNKYSKSTPLFDNEIKTLKDLSKYQIEIGVDANEFVTICKLDIEGNLEVVDMELNDFIYDIDHGTINQPAFHIFEKIIVEILPVSKKLLSEMLFNIMLSRGDFDYLSYLRLLVDNINYVILPQVIDKIVKQSFSEFNLANEDSGIDIINPLLLKTKLKCKLSQSNVKN